MLAADQQQEARSSAGGTRCAAQTAARSVQLSLQHETCSSAGQYKHAARRRHEATSSAGSQMHAAQPADIGTQLGR